MNTRRKGKKYIWFSTFNHFVKGKQLAQLPSFPSPQLTCSIPCINYPLLPSTQSSHFFLVTNLTHMTALDRQIHFINYYISSVLSVLSCISKGSYLTNQTMWTECEQPENIVMWNVVLFSMLLSMGVLQLVVCAIQVINGCMGCICGDCRESKDVRTSQSWNLNRAEIYFEMGKIICASWFEPAGHYVEFTMQCCSEAVLISFWYNR